VTGEPMGDHSIPKGQPRRRPGSAWWRCEQMGHEGGPAQPSKVAIRNTCDLDIDVLELGTRCWNIEWSRLVTSDQSKSFSSYYDSVDVCHEELERIS